MGKESDLKWAEGLPRRKGRAELIKYLKGGRLTARQSINATCFRCSSGYDAGLGCTVSGCPLVPLNYYNLAEKRGDLRAVEEVG